MIFSFLKAVVLIPITLLPIMNPFGIAPVFVNLLGNAPQEITKHIARQVAINCWFLLVGALLIGSHLLSFFGLSLPIVRIGGGLIVAISGWKLLSDTAQDSAISKQIVKSYDLSPEELKLRSFYPISFPLTMGPGAIAISITLGANMPVRLFDWVMSVSSAALGSALTAYIIYLCYRFAARFINLLGRLGTMVVLRLSAFVLLCIGIQILWSGIASLLGSILNS